MLYFMVHIQWLLLYKQNTKPNKHNTKQLLSNTKKLLFILMPTYWQLYANTIYIAYFPIIIYQVSLLTLFRISEKPHKDYFMPIVYMLLTTPLTSTMWINGVVKSKRCIYAGCAYCATWGNKEIAYYAKSVYYITMRSK